MSHDICAPIIQIEIEIRVTYPREAGQLASILKLIRKSGGRLRAHLVYGLFDEATAFFVCDSPAEAALSLEQAGFRVETETVVTVHISDRPGLLSFLVQTLEGQKIDIGYSYATAAEDGVLIVFRTSNNPLAEDILRRYLSPALDD